VYLTNTHTHTHPISGAITYFVVVKGGRDGKYFSLGEKPEITTTPRHLTIPSSIARRPDTTENALV